VRVQVRGGGRHSRTGDDGGGGGAKDTTGPVESFVALERAAAVTLVAAIERTLGGLSRVLQGKVRASGQPLLQWWGRVSCRHVWVVGLGLGLTLEGTWLGAQAARESLACSRAHDPLLLFLLHAGVAAAAPTSRSLYWLASAGWQPSAQDPR
jgi:hypothetical protein